MLNFKYTNLVMVFLMTHQLLAYSADCEIEMTRFIQHPNSEALNAIKKVESWDSKCWLEINANKSKRKLLSKHVQNGNKVAISFVAESLPNLDGGELEDALRMLGESLTSHPSLLLRMTNNQVLTQTNLEDSVTMLPLRFVDRPKATRSELKFRLKKIREVKDNSLSEQREIAINALVDAIDSEVK